MRRYGALLLAESGDDRRASLATPLPQRHPVAHWPLGLGVIRRLAVAPVLARLSPPHPAHGLTCSRGVEALVLAMLDGHQARYKVGQRLEERGMVPWLQPGLTRAALHDSRFGPILAALLAAHRPRGFNATALNALAVSAIPPPWGPQDTTTSAL